VSLVLKEDPDGSVTDGTSHIYAAGKKIATCRRAPGFPLKRTFEISDYLGNLRNVFFYDYYNTLQLGEAIWYNPFGKQDSVIVAGTALHQFTYNGKEFDEGLNLDRYYYGARYYDPQIGRFLTPDPINDDWTPYSYVRNNPIMNNDPTGMSAGGGGGGFDPGPDPSSGWESQMRDLFNSWILEAAGKMIVPRYLVRWYIDVFGPKEKKEPTGGNESDKSDDTKKELSDSGKKRLAEKDAELEKARVNGSRKILEYELGGGGAGLSPEEQHQLGLPKDPVGTALPGKDEQMGSELLDNQANITLRQLEGQFLRPEYRFQFMDDNRVRDSLGWYRLPWPLPFGGPPGY